MPLVLRCLLYASCDADAALIVTDEGAARRIGHDYLAMSQKMWYLARTWAVVLDEVGTLQVEGDLLRQEEIQAIERHVLDLSTLEMEIAYSMTTVEAAGVMLRDTWHIELVEESMRRFGVEVQQRLIERRLHAFARNHDTVSEILDRVHQKSARGQADRLQRLFAGAVAASLTALIPATIQVDQSAVHIATGIGTAVIWIGLAAWIWRESRRQIQLGPGLERAALTDTATVGGPAS